jgi:hypothetical protein
MPKDKLTVTLERKLIERIKHLAKGELRSVSNMIQLLLEKVLKP